MQWCPAFFSSLLTGQWKSSSRLMRSSLCSLCSSFLLACSLPVHLHAAHMIGSQFSPTHSQSECFIIGDCQRLIPSQMWVLRLHLKNYIEWCIVECRAALICVFYIYLKCSFNTKSSKMLSANTSSTWFFTVSSGSLFNALFCEELWKTGTAIIATQFVKKKKIYQLCSLCQPDWSKCVWIV